MSTRPPLDVRPYQLMCLVCRQAAGFTTSAPDRKLARLLAAIRQAPDRPLTLRCNVNDAYAFQNPGHGLDTPEGALFNLKRDLDIVQRLGMTPGATHPSRVVLQRMLRNIPSARGICGYAAVTAPVWQGCPMADAGNYEKGVAAGMAALAPPRAVAAMARAKRASVKTMSVAARLDIRPHHLMCMTCFHGGRRKLAPIPQDNLFEAIVRLQKNPSLTVRLAHASRCMICPPCQSWNPVARQCHALCSLRDQKKDLDVLQKIGLRFGDELPGRELLKRLYKVVHSTREICGCGDGVVRSVEWDGCGRNGNPAYVKGRSAGLGVACVKPI
ncbi:MAG: hypothetical protein HYV35_11945 [Lentisphaerae bacterium]|nr:hypothetical protein [Lentisphaerota bacterium]